MIVTTVIQIRLAPCWLKAEGQRPRLREAAQTNGEPHSTLDKGGFVVGNEVQITIDAEAILS